MENYLTEPAKVVLEYYITCKGLLVFSFIPLSVKRENKKQRPPLPPPLTGIDSFMWPQECGGCISDMRGFWGNI